MELDSRSLVFGKALRVGYLAHIMIKGRRTDERYVRIHRPCDSICQIHDLEGVLEGARSLVGKHSQKRIAGIAEFDELGCGHKSEYLLEEIYERIAGYRKYGTQGHVEDGMIVDRSHSLDKTEGKPYHYHDYKKNQCSHELE